MDFLKIFVQHKGSLYNITEMTMDEAIQKLELKSAPGWDDYLISTEGVVFSRKNGYLKPVSPAPNNDGYLQFVAYGKNKRKWLVHRYLYAAHIGPLLEGYVIRKRNILKEYSKENIEQVPASSHLHSSGLRTSPKPS